MRERILKVKVREIMAWGKDYLLGDAKTVCAREAKQGFIHSFPSTGRYSATFKTEGTHSNVMFSLEVKSQLSECPPFPPPLPQFLLVGMTPHGMGHSFGQLGSVILTASPLSSLCALKLSLAGQHEKQRSPWLCVCSALQQLIQSMCYYCNFHRKSKAWHCTSLCEET